MGGEGGREGAGRGYYTALTTTQGIYPDLKCWRGNHSYKESSFRLVMDQEPFSHVIVDRFLDFFIMLVVANFANTNDAKKLKNN